jgi:hypothetical protein
VKEVNRNVLVKALVALIAGAILSAAMVGLVNAGKGQTKETYWFYVNGSIASPEAYTRTWTTAGGVLQARSEPYSPDMSTIQLKVGGNVIPIIDYSCLIDRTINLAAGTGAIRISESIVIAGGTLEIQTAETISGYGTSDYSVEGSFVGHGTGSLEGVQVQGTTWRLSDGAHIREGTVMGWA